MKNIKPTLKNPTESGEEIDKKFDINEIDGALNEKEHSLKKKIFDLSKMETLVHNDEKLSSIYNEMAEDGEEKYGYHYNETIMNMLFNDYIINNPKYLAKYRATVPKKKKRRDKYGVKDLKKKDSTTKKDETNETTTSGASGQYTTAAAWSNNSMPKMRKPIWNGGSVIGENKEYMEYLTDPKMFKDMYEQINEDFNNADNLNEDHLDTKEEKVAFILKHKSDEYDDIEKLDNMSDEEIDNIYNEIEKEMGVTEETDKNLNEHHLDDKEERIDFIVDNAGDKYGTKEDLQQLNDKSIEAIYLNLEKDMGIGDEKEESVTESDEDDSLDGVLDDVDLDEKAESEAQQKFMGMVRGVQKGEIDPSEVGDDVAKAAENMKKKDVKDFASTKHDDIPEKVNEDNGEEQMYVEYDEELEGEPTFDVDGKRFKYVWAKYPNGKKDVGVYSEDEDLTYNIHWFRKQFLNLNEDTLTEPLSDTMGMSNDRDDSMKNKSDSSVQGMDQGMNEELERLKQDSNYLDQLFEDRKSSSLVQVDRLKKQNKQNFDSDVEKVNDLEKAEDQYTDVGDNPKKYSEDLEDEEIKRTKGEAFKDVGNSTNKKGDEIPKRNITDEEQDDLDMIRDGMHTIAYDSKPSERFEERMKDDMGDNLYDIRKKKMKQKEEEPMYNKDSQPVYDGQKKKQYNKYSKNLGESMFSGKYKNDYGQTKFIDFKYKDVETKDSIDENYKYLNVDGMGNFYDNKVVVNENVVGAIKDYDFYYDDKNDKVVMTNKSKITLDESTKNSFKEMKRLFDYDPTKFVDTTISKSAIK